jgi:hypothetical protein
MEPATVAGPPWQLLERLLARQHGIVALRQLTAFGFHRATFLKFARRHGYAQIGHGLYAAPWSPDTYERDCTVERLRGPRARLLTGRSALVLAGVRRFAPEEVDLWVGPDLRVTERPGVQLYRGRWLAGDRVTRLGGQPCVPVLRALRDAARDASVDRLKKDIAAADRLRLATPQRVLADLHRAGGFRGKPKLRQAALESCEGLVHSADEAAARQLLTSLPLVPHPRPLLIEHGSWRLGEVDIPFCGIRYGVEVDGPLHLLDGEEERDAARDARLEQVEWLIDRFPDTLIRESPREFVEAVRKGMREAAARGVAPWPCSRCVA